jgi:hypothetical protein
VSEESIRKLRETNIAKYGSEENYLAEMKRRAIMGGKAGRGPGFKDKELASRAGKLSGEARKKRRENELPT